VAFKVRINPKARKEFISALAYYAAINPKLEKEFNEAYFDRLDTLAIGWAWFQIRYSKVRFAKIGKFPFWVHFIVDENEQTVRILYVHHEKLKPRIA
jgi:hypothetical protein